MKYEVLINFTDKYDYSKKYEEGKTYTFTKERAEEILKVGKLIKEVKSPKKTKE